MSHHRICSTEQDLEYHKVINHKIKRIQEQRSEFLQTFDDSHSTFYSTQPLDLETILDDGPNMPPVPKFITKGIL